MTTQRKAFQQRALLAVRRVLLLAGVVSLLAALFGSCRERCRCMARRSPSSALCGLLVLGYVPLRDSGARPIAGGRLEPEGCAGGNRPHESRRNGSQCTNG